VPRGIGRVYSTFDGGARFFAHTKTNKKKTNRAMKLPLVLARIRLDTF
jgi:hypothetical protein